MNHIRTLSFISQTTIKVHIHFQKLCIICQNFSPNITVDITQSAVESSHGHVAWCDASIHRGKTKLYVYLCTLKSRLTHYDVIKWKHFPRNWQFVRGIHRSPVNFPHKGQLRGALMYSLICVWINGWVNNREAGDLRRYRAHDDVTVMWYYNRLSRNATAMDALKDHLGFVKQLPHFVIRTYLFLIGTWIYPN